MQNFKSNFFQNPTFRNLNNAGQGSVSLPFKNAVTHWLTRFYEEGSHSMAQCWEEVESARSKTAKFLGAQSDELAFFQTTASALSQAALGIPLQSGDEVLTWDQEYPSNFYPWRIACEKSGAKLIQVPSENFETPARKILDRVTAKTKVITISWVQYQTGSVTDLKYISDQLKDRNIWLVADVIQGIGIRPFNFKESGFDIICGGSHKWLCSAFGAAFMVVKKEKMLQLGPAAFGAMTFGNADTPKSFDLKPKTSAHRFEPGTLSFAEIIGLGATIDLFNQTGIVSVSKEAERLALRLSKGISDLGFTVNAANGAFVNFSNATEIEKHQIDKKLKQAQISSVKRGKGIRVTPHAYNTDNDIDYFLNSIR